MKFNEMMRITMKKIAIYSFVTGVLASSGAFAASDSIVATSAPPQYEAPSKQARALFAGDTTTYVKCVYKVGGQDDSNPTSSWLWAKVGSNYAKLKGYWYNSMPLANMFYTEAPYAEVMNLCTSTLAAAGVSSTIVIPYASDYTLSYYYVIWNQGANQPVVNVGGRGLDRMVVFGDSLSDTINVYNGSYGTVPNSKSWLLGHFSNGKLWHEYLSTALNLPSYVWATGNAESGEKPFFNGFGKQMDSFRDYHAHAKGYDIGKTLFTVLFGGNDFVTGGKSADEVIAQYTTQLNRLAQLGAKQVAVFRLPDFSVIPNVAKWTDADKAKLKENSVQFNDKVEKLIAKLNAEYPQTTFYTLKLDEAFKQVLENSGQYGFVNKTDTCLDVSQSGYSYAVGGAAKAACKTSNAAFVFWDNMHPTTKTHGLLAELLKAEVVRGLAAP
jgi:thermolabile hemolysin